MATLSQPVRMVVGSENPVKIAAAIRGYQRMFPGVVVFAEGLACDSGVSHQPMSDEETRSGAWERVQQATQLQPQANCWVGLEGGVDLVDGQMFAFAWAVVRSPQRQGQSRSGTFLLPDPVRELIQQGIELGSAVDQIYGQQNSKQHGGAIGILSGGKISRTDLYAHAVSLALVSLIESPVPGIPMHGVR